MTEEHLAVLRRHMVELIAIHADLACEELGKAALDGRVTATMGKHPARLAITHMLARCA
jgi:protein-L-isoaspartate(D-aspartate) O-methyltransferase